MTADRAFPRERVGARQQQPWLMRTRWRLPMAVAAVAGLAAMALVAAPAQAQTMICVGTVTKTTVRSSAVVPKGEACFLVDVNVIGNVDVQANADLLMERSSVRAVIGGSSAFVFANGSMISRGVTLNQSFGMQAFSSFVKDGVQVFGDPNTGGAVLFAEDTHFIGNVGSSAGWTVLRDGQINGRLDTGGDRATDLFRMRVHGVSVDKAGTGSVICDFTSHGDFSVTNSLGVIQIGGPFPTPACPGNKFVGNLTVTGNNATDIQISSNQIIKDLICSGNSPTPVGHGNIVLGATTGQCDGIGMATESMGTQSLIPPPGSPGDEEAATEEERVDKILARIAERELIARMKVAEAEAATAE